MKIARRNGIRQEAAATAGEAGIAKNEREVEDGRGPLQSNTVNELSCPTVAGSSIEFQALSSRLSHHIEELCCKSNHGPCRDRRLTSEKLPLASLRML
jgi:hypothetical protein